MRIFNSKPALCGLVIFTGLSAFVPAVARPPAAVGRVINSFNATVEGDPLFPNSPIFSGDDVNVGPGGSVVLGFSPTGRAVLAPATQVRFSGSRGNWVAQLLSGSVAVGRQEKDAVEVRTPSYDIRPDGVGRSEFVVALLPDNKATVDTERGKVLVTDRHWGERYTIAEGLLAQISPTQTGPLVQSEKQHKVIGNVVSSAGATANGKALAQGEWVNDGDAVSTEGGGRTVIHLLPTNQVTLEDGTSVNVTMPYDRVLLQLLSGTMVVENKGDRNVLVATTKFHIEPNTTGPTSIFVSIKADNSTDIDALLGDVKIRDIQSDQTYVLPSGQNVIIPADASGVPGLQPLPSAGGPTPPAGPPPSQPPLSQPPPPTGSQGHSHTTLIIIGVAAGGGIAGIIAATQSGGHSGGSAPVVPPTSPVTP
jgi:ferric-dicitrate binding protein FerR (iron transport regulator)